MKKERCIWCLSSEKMIEYHDSFWGMPLHNDRELFAKLVLDINQAGLSWSTILNKQENFYHAFENFEIAKVANYGNEEFSRLKVDAGIIRNTQKIWAAIHNAQCVQEIQREFGSFDAYIWNFVEGKPIQHHINTESEIPASDELSDRVSKNLKSRGFKFVGTTIIYAYLQAIGVINDHVKNCFRYKELV